MPSENIHTEKELLLKAADGDEQAFRQIYDKYWEDLFNAAHKRTRNAEDARDIVQDLFVSFWNNLSNIIVEESVGAYLFVTLRNKVLNHLEKKSVRLQYLLQQPFQPVASEEAILSGIRTKEIRECIAAVIAAMPTRMKEVYILSKEQQLTIADIAGLLDISPQTAKNQLHTALERIRAELKQQGLAKFILLIG